MFTKLFLMIKNFPNWLKTTKTTYPVLYIDFWAFNFLVLLLLLIIHVPLIIQGNYPVYTEVYDEYFTYMLAIILITGLGILSNLLHGKLRPVMLIVLYFISISAAVIAFVLSVTI